MVVIWLSALIFVWMVRCAEKYADSDKSSGVAYSYCLWSLSGVLWIWGHDIAGQSIRQYIAGDGAYPVLLLLSVIAGIAAVLCAGWEMFGKHAEEENCSQDRLTRESQIIGQEKTGV